MIQGIGNDILEIQRIRKTIEQHGSHFYKKIFNKEELAYCLAHKDPAIALAGRFAAKEAIAKAMGTGFGASISFLDIEVLNDAKGRPYAEFSDSFKKIFSNPSVLLSISHCKEYATAVALYLQP